MTTTSEGERRLAAVWFADIVGYTTLSAKNEDAALEIVGMLQQLAEEIVAAHGGRVVKYIGDAALAEFVSTDGAVRSALALMERFCEDDTVREHGSTLRIGVNVGEVISSTDGDIYGDGVNLASRLQNQAEPGQVVASDAVHAQIRQRPVFRSQALGQRAVKGISSPVPLYAVTLQDASGGPRAVGTSGGGRARWIVPTGLASVVALVAVYFLDPGGVVGLVRAPLDAWLVTGVEVVQTTYPVVEGGLEVGGSITLEFNREIDQGTATSRNIRLVDDEGTVVPAQVSLESDARSVLLDPSAALAYGAAYSVMVSDSLKGAEGESVVTSGVGGTGITVAIRTQPVPAGGVRPAAALAEGFDADRAPAGGPVPVRFTAPIDPATANGGGIRLTDRAGAVVEANLLFTDGNLEVRVEPRRPLARGGRYAVVVDSTVLSPTGLAALAWSGAFRVALPVPSRPAQTQPSASSGAGARPAESAPASGPGRLHLTVVPAAARPFVRVVLDGDTLGPVPAGGLALAEGTTHSLVLVGVPDLSAYTMPVYRRSIPVEPGQIVNLTAQITAFGSIDVVSEPSGAVFIDGRQVGRTPLAGYPVEAGVIHSLEIRPSEADEDRVAPLTAEFRVEALEWKSLGRLTLPPRG